MTTADGDGVMLLTGLDGHNPLAYLAALGALRVVSRVWPERQPRLGWRAHGGGWRPELALTPICTPEELASTLDDTAGHVEEMIPERLERASMDVGAAGRLRFPTDEFRATALDSIAQADEVALAWMAAWASDVERSTREERFAVRTRFDFTAGQQAFVVMMAEVREQCRIEHLRECLFSAWRRVPGTSMRWDPLDEKRQYALQAIDPTNATLNPILTTPGANLLALEALPLLPVLPTARGTGQAGFEHGAGGLVSWSWPIWEGFVIVDTVRSLLAFAVEPAGDARARGIVARYRSFITMPSGRYRCFAPAVQI